MAGTVLNKKWTVRSVKGMTIPPISIECQITYDQPMVLCARVAGLNASFSSQS